MRKLKKNDVVIFHNWFVSSMDPERVDWGIGVVEKAWRTSVTDWRGTIYGDDYLVEILVREKTDHEGYCPKCGQETDDSPYETRSDHGVQYVGRL